MNVERREHAAPQPRAAVPLLHPVALAAVVTLVVNDHVFKAAAPGWLTGKLSDIAGLLFFPLFLHAVATGVVRARVDPRRLLVAAIVVTGSAFAAVKVAPVAAEAYRVGLGMLQWPLAALATWTTGVPGYEGPPRVSLSRDPTDLIALPVLALSYLVGVRALSLRATSADRPRLRVAPARVAWPRLAVVLAAALASLATSPGPPSIRSSYDGNVALGSDVPVATRRLEITLPPAAFEGATAARATIYRRNRGSAFDRPFGDLPVQLQLAIGPDGTLPRAEAWRDHDAEILLRRDICDPARDCTFDVWAHLRWTGGAQAEVVVPWTFDASIVYDDRPPAGALRLQADPTGAPPPLFLVALLGMAVGAAVGVASYAVAVRLARGPSRGASGVRAAVAGSQVVLIGILVTAGVLVASHPSATPFWARPADTVAGFLVLAFVVAAGAVRWWRSRGASLLVAAHLMTLLSFSVVAIWAFRASPAYRPPDLAGALAVSSAVIALTLRALVPEIRPGWSRTTLPRLALGAHLVLIATMVFASLAIALPQNDLPVHVPGGLALGAGLISVGVLRSLGGAPLMLGLVDITSAVLAVFPGLVLAAVLGGLLDRDQTPTLVTLGVAVASLLLGVDQLRRVRPVRRDARPA